MNVRQDQKMCVKNLVREQHYAYFIHDYCTVDSDRLSENALSEPGLDRIAGFGDSDWTRQIKRWNLAFREINFEVQ